MVDIIAYEDKYREEVVNCVKRNYEKMGKCSFEDINEWMRPLLEYPWCDWECKYKNGILLVADNHVVGYFGLLYSRHRFEDAEYIYVNPTTWAVDNEFRIYIFKVIAKIHETADIIGDFTPRESVRSIFIKKFKYSYLSNWQYKYITVFWKKRKGYIEERLKEENMDNYAQKILSTHEMCNVKCILFQTDGMNGRTDVFYHIKKMKIKKINVKTVEILNVTDYEVFTENLREILYWIWKKEKIMFCAIDEFFLARNLQFKPIWKSEVHKLMWSKDGKQIKERIPGLLYSELCIKHGKDI